MLLSTMLMGVIPSVRALNFSSPLQVPMGATLTLDSKMLFLDAAPASGTALKTDSHIKYVDTDGNNVWDPGEAVLYDTNNNGVYVASDPVIAGTPTLLAMLHVDSKLKFVDVNNNGVWAAGEPVVYDNNNDNLYETGEPVVAGSPPQLQALLSVDSKVKFVDANNNGVWDTAETVVYDTFGKGYYNASIDPHIKFVDSNNTNVWNLGKTVVYDSNNNGIYDSGEPVLYGTMPPVGTTLKQDSRIRFVDANRNGTWASGEAIVYDSNNDGFYESTEPVIVLANPAPRTVLSSDSHVKYWDSNNTNSWNPGKTVVLDTFGKGYYNATIDPKIKYWDSDNNGIWDPGTDPVIYDSNNDGTFECGEPLIAGSQPPCNLGLPLTSEKHFRFVDSTRIGRWASGDAVVYDSNLDNIYDTGDVSVTAIPPPVGTLLSEPVITGSVPPIGTLIKIDSKIRFVDATNSGFWNPGDAVIYDSDSNGLYETGEPVIIGGNPASGTLLSEPVVAGLIPAYGTLLKIDPKIKFVDADKNLVWDVGEMVVYDSNGNGVYDLGEPIIANGARGDGVWHQGEPVIYDSNKNGVYDTGEPMVYGSSPPNQTVLRVDAHIKFIDTDANLVWDPGETAAYDSNNSGVYVAGDPIIVGAAPPDVLPLHPSVASDPLGRIWLEWNEAPIGTTLNPNIYFKTWNGTIWSNKQQVTSNAGINNDGSLAALSNNTMIIVWSSNRTGHPQLFYTFYADTAQNPYPTALPTQLTSNSASDTNPSVVQDRNGRIWVTWSRQSSTASLSSIYYKYYNGTSWSMDSIIPSTYATTLQVRSPSIAQAKDGRLWVVFASNDTTASALYYTTTNGTISPLPSAPVNSWTTKLPLYASSTSNEDDRPSVLQARDGGLWVFFQRSTTNSESIMYTNSSSNGASWASPVSLTSAPDQTPAAGQMPDHRIWVFWDRQGSTTTQIVYSSSDQINNIHDVGLRNIGFGSRIIESADTLNVSVTAVNYGDFSESTTLNIKANNTIIDTVTLSLSIGQVQLVQFSWQTAYPNWGRYTLTATLTPVPGESVINQGDDSIGISWVRVSPPGDVNRDGSVGIDDLAIIALAYHSSPGSPNWNPLADVDKDSYIGISDLSICALYYHKSVL